MKTLLILMLMVVFTGSILSAGTMFVHLASGAVHFALADIEQMTFVEDELNIHLVSGITEDFSTEDILQITFSEETSAEDMVELVSRIPIRFLRNYPNPFNPETTISFELNQRGRTEVEVYNIKGQLVRVLLDDMLDIGSHTIVWNGRNESNVPVSSGVYLYRVSFNGSKYLSKMIMVK